MEAIQNGQVDVFLNLVQVPSPKNEVLIRTRRIFDAQKVSPFGDSKEEELKAAYREAVAVEKCEDFGTIARAAATEQVHRLAKQLRRLDNSKETECNVHQFYRMAYDLKCMFRTEDVHSE